MQTRRTIPAALVLALLALPSAAVAGVGSYDGATAAFSDPSGARDEIGVDLSNEQAQFDSDGIEGWRVSFFQTPATAVGPGCVTGFVSTVCATGPTPPANLLVDLGGGDDDLELSSDPPSKATRTTALGGDGNDKLAKYQTFAHLDGGPGDDLLLPDTRYSVTSLPPEPTPGELFRGGSGTDTIDYSGAFGVLNVSLDGKANDGRPGENDNVADDIENVTGSSFVGRLIGSDRANVITNGGSDALLVGMGGRDTLKGGSGSETFDALDGAGGDRISCESGADVVFADAGDVIASGETLGGAPCEKVTYAPGLNTSSLRYLQNRVALSLTCPKGATCRGSLRLTSKRDGEGSTVARASYRVKAGRRATVRLKPGSSGRRALGRTESLKGTLFVSPKGRSAPAGRAVTVR